MAKKTVPAANKVLELTKTEAQLFDPDLKKEIEEEKLPKPVKIRAICKDRLRLGPYAVVDRGIDISEHHTRREAYDKALDINEKRGFSTQTVEEIFD